ncbi:mercury(II) reductase [Haloechinothrix halophila]|uniref:mercury(II) reductase n=1 Tax=Haloechinothrix halophila TaxID=1069073 RepID=UPI0004014A72|nr:mercury(II) reductase [Haloechinothrix halophila]
MSYDLAIIGSGSGAFAAAISARRKGKTVVMIERGTVGGTCVNTGCVPSKALLAAAEARHVALDQHFPGIHTSAEPVDAAALSGATQELVANLRTDKYVDLAAEYGWDILDGQAHFVDGPSLHVDLADGHHTRITAEHYLVATGSTPYVPPIDGIDEVNYLTSTTAMALAALPESLIVIGGNYVGLEQAQLFAHLGVRVTVVEMLDRLAPNEEPEISAGLRQIFTDQGITVHTGTTITAAERRDEQVVVSLRDGDGHTSTARADNLLVATGRTPTTDGLNLPAVGVKLGARGEIVVDDHLRSHHPRIWAAGDVTGHPQFVYVAAAHGAVMVDNAFDGAGRTLEYHHLPRVTFTTPAIAAAGLTDTQAVEHGYDCECRVLPLEYVPRALVNRDTRGLIKLVAERGTGRLLGAHVLADNAGDAITTAVYALANTMTVHQMANLWCPYLTMAEGIKLAAQAFTRDIATLSCCAS